MPCHALPLRVCSRDNGGASRQPPRRAPAASTLHRCRSRCPRSARAIAGWRRPARATAAGEARRLQERQLQATHLRPAARAEQQRGSSGSYQQGGLSYQQDAHGYQQGDSAQQGQPYELPYPWVQLADQNGAVYYSNPQTGEASWDPP